MVSTNRRRPDAGWAACRLPVGPSGRNLCRQCSREVPPGRRTFCGDGCVHEWKLRSDPGYCRDQVYARDSGVCGACGLDTDALRTAFAELHWNRELLPFWPHELAAIEKIRNQYVRSTAARDIAGTRARLIGFNPDRNTWWDADHIVPVAEGGGECDLTNFRTLCLPCHKRVTAELRQRLKAKRDAAKPQGKLPGVP